MRQYDLVIVVTLLLGCPAWAASVSHAPSGEEAAKELARHLLSKSDTTRGICVILGYEDAVFPKALLRASGFLVHILEPDPATVEAGRNSLDTDGLYLTRVILDRFSFSRLPYADNFVDLILAPALHPAALQQVSLDEISRVLRPRGKVILGSRKGMRDGVTRSVLREWLASASSGEGGCIEDDAGIWAEWTKPVPDNTDAWGHWNHGPDNNPVSADQTIRAPFRTQWLGKPYYIAMPSVTTAAGGRVFLAMGHIAHHKREEPWLNTLLARNAYNGRVLWKRKLPDGYLVHRSAFLATEDTFYMIDLDGNGCVLLDPETGYERDEIRSDRMQGEWKWMALQDNVLFILAGDRKDPAESTLLRTKFGHWSWNNLSEGYYGGRIPWGFGKRLAAYDIAAKTLLWVHEEDVAMDSRAMVMGGGKLFLYCPGSHIARLDAKTGKVDWRTGRDSEAPGLIEAKGRNLTSTPGFKTSCLSLYTPKALIYQGPTRMNTVAVSPEDGRVLWHRKKTTNSPNMLYADGHLFIGLGPRGSTLRIDPATGEMLEDLKFGKHSCARLTATPDSFFCRGMPEGITRYDRLRGKITYNGAIRPSCNDGVIAADGLLHISPWLCDCNLSLMGTVVLGPSGDGELAGMAVDEDRLATGPGSYTRVADFEMSGDDWPTYRSDNDRTGGSPVRVAWKMIKVWSLHTSGDNLPTAPVAAGGFIFVAGSDGKVRAMHAATGVQAWSYRTSGPIMQAPTVWNGRVYVGSGDGFLHALEAGTGRLLWKFRAAPVERRTMVYGSLCSTWPVNSGVLVADGVAYAAAGIIDYDGTYVYALDAVTGKMKWQNSTSGHLNKAVRKGVSAQGNLVILDGRLWMPGGNIISPAAYDLATGRYLGRGAGNGTPRANRGEEIAVFSAQYLIHGGRLRFSSTDNIINPGKFQVYKVSGLALRDNRIELVKGKVPPVWDDVCMVVARPGPVPVLCFSRGRAAECFSHREAPGPRDVLWQADGIPRNADVLSVVLTGNAVLVATSHPMGSDVKRRIQLYLLGKEDGRIIATRELPRPPVPGGMIVDRNGRIIIALNNGRILCLGGERAVSALVDATDPADAEGVTKAVDVLTSLVQTAHDPDTIRSIADRIDKLAGRDRADAALGQTFQNTPGLRRQLLLADLFEERGMDVLANAKKQGILSRWHLIGVFPWNGENPMDRIFVDEPNVDLAARYTTGGRACTWTEVVTAHPSGMVDLTKMWGQPEDTAAYAHASFHLPDSRDLLLKIGSDDGFKCWFNGEAAGLYEGQRAYQPDQTVLRVRGRKGDNRLLLKVTQIYGQWAFGVRVTEPDGTPVDFTRGRPAHDFGRKSSATIVGGE